ncbi:alpha/beta hydrolase [Candidatus Sulfidibacterium hydrothermale]|uniref:alpha/beta hydrolase n=1 Tax=Candidatus Sulfidibacterium hydrothermale TaxID=2875962 RepID=UPI001F0B2581|nr:alpha/beta hydrolase [Candidatus Sulfidibacterium hydrothermale]UBM63346.1 alpha/beta hydrolase [Candidatus Sulfidibacterium hydrothermale]
MKKENGYTFHTLTMKPDDEGEVVATLIEKKAANHSKKALLYIHGFNDYFFQDHFAEWANQQGFNFYALELRKYGRSILPHQKPNDFKDYHEYFEDIDAAVTFIREKEKNEKLVLVGHSTGGLIAALYAHEHRNDNKVDALILNSPFFEFNVPAFLKKTFIPLMVSLAGSFPKLPSPVGLDKGYGYSLHKSHNGEWDYDLDLKPDAGFKIHASWIKGIYTAQKTLQKGLDIACPVLVMYSAKSVKPGNYRPDMQHADAVLNVKDIEHYADVIGKNVEKASFEGGVHDLLLSQKQVRDKVFQKMEEFLKNNL